MAKAKPKTKKAKAAKVSKVLGEHKRGKLKSSSGRKVKSKAQAVAIALSKAGLSKKRRKE